MPNSTDTVETTVFCFVSSVTTNIKLIQLVWRWGIKPSFKSYLCDNFDKIFLRFSLCTNIIDFGIIKINNTNYFYYAKTPYFTTTTKSSCSTIAPFCSTISSTTPATFAVMVLSIFIASMTNKG
jgi:hypothetical protein